MMEKFLYFCNRREFHVSLPWSALAVTGEALLKDGDYMTCGCSRLQTLTSCLKFTCASASRYVFTCFVTAVAVKDGWRLMGYLAWVWNVFAWMKPAWEARSVLTIFGLWQGGPILLPVATASKADASDANEATTLGNSDRAQNSAAGMELETAGAAIAAAVLKQHSVMDFARYFRRV
jgi:hypothetical protein